MVIGGTRVLGSEDREMDYFPFREIESHDHSPQVQMLSYLQIEAGAPRGECWVSTTTGQHNRRSRPQDRVAQVRGLRGLDNRDP